MKVIGTTILCGVIAFTAHGNNISKQGQKLLKASQQLMTSGDITYEELRGLMLGIKVGQLSESSILKYMELGNHKRSSDRVKEYTSVVAEIFADIMATERGFLVENLNTSIEDVARILPILEDEQLP